nr:uncharacterized protein LOC124816455 [Hydra vulgaris]
MYFTFDQKDDAVQITKQLIESLNKRFFSHDNLNITDDERYVLPTIIDPRYKLKFLPVDKRGQARSMLLDAVVKNQRNITGLSAVVINRATSSTTTISNHLTPNSKKKKVDLEENDFNSCFLELAEYEGNLEQNSETNPDQVSLVKAAQEVDFFSNNSIIEKKEDVFNYWKHEEKFPF